MPAKEVAEENRLDVVARRDDDLGVRPQNRLARRMLPTIGSTPNATTSGDLAAKVGPRSFDSLGTIAIARRGAARSTSQLARPEAGWAMAINSGVRPC